MIRRGVLLVAILAAVAAGCADAENPQPQARFPDQGLQATGRLDGRRVAISSGNPDVVSGDCDAGDGLDEDLCMVVRTIDGEQVNVVIENPDVLVAGEQVDVRPDACTGAACDGVTGHAVVDIRVGGGSTRALSGSITPGVVSDSQVSADFRFGLAGGDQLVGSFNIVR